MNLEIITPLMIGLVGSFHCIGMCGPIAVALPLSSNSWFNKITGVLIYNLGRTITYGFMGLVFGMLGQGIELAGFQRWVSIGLGIVIILSILYPYIIQKRINFSGLFTGYAARLINKLKALFREKSYNSLALIGLLNGLLPCGLVYVAIAGAINTTHIVSGAMFMVLFGLGTIPMMMLVSLAGNVVGTGLRRKMQKVVPYFIILLGVLFILRGMSLGIPYVSPKAQKLSPVGQVEDSGCCH